MSRFSQQPRDESRLAFKRRPGESVVVDGTTRITVLAIRRAGGRPVGVRLELADFLTDGRVARVTFDLRTGDAAPCGLGVAVHVRMAYGGPNSGRCRLLFVGDRSECLSIHRGEVVTDGPWANTAAAAAIGGGR